MSLDIYLYYEVEPEVRQTVYDANITHNLGDMAQAAGIYDALWHLKHVHNAGDLAAVLEDGIRDMKRNPAWYNQHDAESGWGTYEQFLPWLIELHAACVVYPNAKLEVSR